MSGVRHAVRRVLVLGVTILIAAMVPGEAPAFNGNNQRDAIVTYCVQSGPDDFGTAALAITDEELRDVVDAWETAASATLTHALTLTVNSRGSTCSADVIIRAYDASPKAWVGNFEPDGSQLYISLNERWDWSSTAEEDEYDVGHVLAHELGHTFGLGHQGNGAFWDKGGNMPTMGHAAQLWTEVGETIETDDWGGASYARGGGSGSPIWSANPGFEGGKSKWTVSTGVKVGTDDVYSGSKRAMIPGDGSTVRAEHTYDPWNINDGVVQTTYPTMSAYPYVTHNAYVKDKVSPAGSGSIRLQRRWRYFEYDADEDPGDMIPKNASYAQQNVTTDWSVWTDVATSTPPGSWTALGALRTYFLGTRDDGQLIWHKAVNINLRLRNNSGEKILADEIGLSGGV